MNVGTKSILFGAHQFIMHPILVVVAWYKLYEELPTFWELVAIVIHDWGYWGKPNMDGPEGEEHPVWAYNVLLKLRRPDEASLCLRHSRFKCKQMGERPSRLCYADKLANALVPPRLYVILTTATGELYEYLSATKHESVRHSGSNLEFVYRFRGVVRLVLLTCSVASVREYAANKWDIPHIECTDQLNA